MTLVKSEISKSISDSIISGSFFIKDFESDFNKVDEIINFNYFNRFKVLPEKGKTDSRSFLSSKRSMGSSIKLLTPSPEFTDQYNAWLESIPQYIKGISFIVKRITYILHYRDFEIETDIWIYSNSTINL